MTGFSLLLAHLIGDFILQEDWQAGNKTNPHPGRAPGLKYLPNDGGLCWDDNNSCLAWVTWNEAKRKWWLGHLACTVHCLIYTATVFLFCFWFLPWWAYPVIFVSHWPWDRFRVARLWMVYVSHQKAFATGALAPWSVIVVDQIYHLLVLWALGMLS